jgi:hypothetical protein
LKIHTEIFRRLLLKPKMGDYFNNTDGTLKKLIYYLF